ncbi:hypothetical protein CGI23_24890 [Vibrio parahaemolyticus]|nr:hypothetical protein CGI23_24890 [Vibrio parahaemolyticus]
MRIFIIILIANISYSHASTATFTWSGQVPITPPATVSVNVDNENAIVKGINDLLFSHKLTELSDVETSVELKHTENQTIISSKL